jgi:hypothetical protein
MWDRCHGTGHPVAGLPARYCPHLTTAESHKEEAVTDVAKKSVTLLVIAFALFYLFTQPENAADAVRGAGNAVGDGFQAVIRFFNALAG